MNSNAFLEQANRWLGWISKRHDMSLALIFVCAIFMMILPLPTQLIDVLLSINLSFSLLLLMISIYLKSPAEFSAFPSVLLMTTLFRLSLTVSTSRLILLQHDAGEIISAFGNFVVGGNLVVGIIIFCIITIVQFIVITKGSERVAEVSARFSLDAMPGKQMSIDGDMRAGTIEMDEAKRLRNLVQQESQLYGAMDGAMKFVKGDAVASIIVILVNILGGITVGVLQHGMSMTQAAAEYTVLSIGDGLVSQIPALIISITSGIIVTRVPGASEENLGNELFQQLGQHSGALLTAAVIVSCFSLVPGFPAWAFLSLGALLGVVGYVLKTQYKEHPEKKKRESTAEKQLGAVPLAVALPKQWSTSKVQEMFKTFRDDTFEKLGLPLPEIHLNVGFDRRQTEGSRFVIYLYQEPACEVIMPENQCLCVTNNMESVIGGEALNLPFGRKNLYWVDPKKLPKEKEHINIFEKEDIALYFLREVIESNAKEFLGMQEVRYLMDGMEGKYSELVREVQRQLPTARITDILQRLIEEKISIRNLRGIFEAILAWHGKEKDVVLFNECIRVALHRHIISLVRDPDGKIRMWHIGEGLDTLVRDSVRQTTSGAYAALEPEQTAQVIDLINGAVQQRRPAHLLTDMGTRRYLRKLIEGELPDIEVFSKQEIGEDYDMEILGNIEWVGKQNDAQ